MRKIYAAVLEGLKNGALIYLCFLFCGIQPTPVTSQNIASILFFSGVIGVVSLIFENDHWPFVLNLLIHFLVTAGLFTLTMFYNGWGSYVTSMAYLMNFLVAYVVVWLANLLANHWRIQKINEALSRRKQQS